MRVKHYRLAKSLTQDELAELSGLAQSAIAYLERERSSPPDPKWSTVARISYSLGELPEDVFGLPLPFTNPPRRVRKWRVRRKERAL